ncbi:MAG TPA: hypothetical protein VIK22_08725 [Candidatus Anoxymicrobiaceae bacterium]
MLENRLIEIIKDNGTDVAQRWYWDMQESNYVPSLHRLSEEDGMAMAMDVYNTLCEWLQPPTGIDIKEKYQKFGGNLHHRGFQMEEVVQVLVLLKRYLWLHLLEMGLMTTNLNMYQVLELNNKIVLYYDRAIYFALIGYKESRRSADRVSG